MVLSVACLGSDPPAPTTQPASAPAKGPVKLFDAVRVHLAAREVLLDAEVVSESAELEFLLCQSGTKDYESILATPAKPSHVHAALLLLGLTPGRPARWIEIEDEDPRFVSPRGPELQITFRWTGADGKTRTADASDWLALTGRGKGAMPKKWIFIGSAVLPDNHYLADAEGEIISVANFASAVIDVPFESSDKNAILTFSAKAGAVPPRGTKVEVVLHPLDGAEKSPYARALLEIDRFGRLRIDNQPIEPADLIAWAQKFIGKHARGQVILRADARALVFDVAQAESELRLGGVRDFDLQRLEPVGQVLPRTPRQATACLDDWARRFANPKDYLHEPGAQSEDVLRQIEFQIRELDARKSLWEEYAQHLQAQLKAYRATTQPAGAKGKEP